MLYEKIVAGEEKIALVGLGYVGMPIAVAFAKKVNLGVGTIRNIEYNLIEPNQRYCAQIVSACNVDPVWLETGEGEMFRKLSRQEQIADFVGKALTDDSGDFRSQLISILVALDDVGWYKLEEAAKAIKEAEEKIKGS